MALLNSIITERPKKEGSSFGIVMVHYTRLIPSENNNYSVDNIRELANMIKLSGGIKQNLLARKKTPEEYELIAGHRRRLAVKYLVEEEGLQEYAMLPVHVEKTGDVLSEIDLLLTNCAARERSDWEKMMEVTRLTELVKAMQTGTEEEQERFRQLFGRDPGMTGGRELRKLIAETLGLSETKVANLNHINSSLSPELKERFEGGEIGVSVANEAAGLPAEKQQELAKKEEIKLADVKAAKEEAVSESDTGKEQEQVVGQMCFGDVPGDLTKPPVPEKEEGFPYSADQDSFMLQKEQQIQEECCEIAAEPLSAYGTPKRVYPPDSLIACEGCEGGHDCFCCAMDCRIRGKERYCMDAPLGNPFSCEIVKYGFGEAPDTCQFVNHDLAYHRAGDNEPDPCCKQCQNPCEYMCGRAMKALDQQGVAPVPEATEEVLAADQETEVPDIELLRGMLKKENELLDKFLKVDKVEKLPKDMIRKKKLLVGALAGMLCDLENADGQGTAQATEQPELPVMKNNDQRKAFLDTFHDWPVWFEVPEASEVYYRYDLPDGCSLVICEYHFWKDWVVKFGYEGSPEATWTREYILIPGYHYLNDCQSNRTAMAEKLKEIQKK